MKQLINVTDITGWIYCPRKLWLKKTKFLKEPLNAKMVSGRFKHEVFDILNKNEQSLVNSISGIITEKDILTLYKTNFEKIVKETYTLNFQLFKQFSIDYTDFLNETLRLYSHDLELRSASIKIALDKGFLKEALWKNITPKYVSEFSIVSETLGLKGRIDRMKVDNSILPYEIKSRKEIFESDKIQLAAYALLLESEFSQEITKGIVEVDGKEEEIALTSELKAKVFEIADQIRNIQQPPPLNSNFSKCQSCPFQKHCFED